MARKFDKYGFEILEDEEPLGPFSIAYCIFIKPVTLRA